MTGLNSNLLKQHVPPSTETQSKAPAKKATGVDARLKKLVQEAYNEITAEIREASKAQKDMGAGNGYSEDEIRSIAKEMIREQLPEIARQHGIKLDKNLKPIKKETPKPKPQERPQVEATPQGGDDDAFMPNPKNQKLPKDPETGRFTAEESEESNALAAEMLKNMPDPFGD